LAIVAADLAGAIFEASGASHSAGAVPDPGSSAGTTRYLREDATWVVPTGGYYGDAVETAAGGESIITLGSTPSDPNTIKAFLNGALLDSDQYTISSNVLTMTANRFGVGDRVRVMWSTNSATPGGIALTSSSTSITNFAAYADGGSGSAVTVPFPAGAAAGDLAVIFLGTSQGSGQTTPTGWTLVDNSNSSGTFWGGQVFSKTLTAADLALGSVTFTASLELFTAAIVTFTGSPTITDYISSRAGTTPITLTTGSVAPTGSIALYFGSQGATPGGSNGAVTWNRGTSRATINNGGGSSTGDSAAIYSEMLGSSGTVTGIVTYATPTSAHNYQAIVIVSPPQTAEGSFPEIRQSQISGFTPVADTGAANAYAVATAPAFGLVKGAFVSFIAANANTGASTLAVNGGTAVAIKKNGNSTALVAGDITAGQIVDATYDGTVWQIAAFFSLTTTGTSGAASLSGGVLNVPQYSGGGGGAGSLILLEQHTASSSTELDFTSWDNSAYDEYEIHIINLVCSTTSTVGIQCSTNGGSSYDTASNYLWTFAFTYSGGSGNASGSSQTAMNFRDTTSAPQSNQAYRGRIVLYDPASTSLYKDFQGEIAVPFQSGSALKVQWQGRYNSTTAVNAFRLIPSAGNFVSGTVRIYGVMH
jgi:hypothetical protein